eukprot:TRINITY_DN11268_c0_g1_i2.p1 TRINITY_DN11268_c0_g1~~TRINITY_DN11268_c0_g1_i2.p1  ORF type:complete len:424 (+),score=90.57 TRINITY_DN11268_c0_g1_i2:45-1316(+)
MFYFCSLVLLYFNSFIDLPFFFFFNDTATTEIYTLHIVGSVRCVQETGTWVELRHAKLQQAKENTKQYQPKQNLEQLSQDEKSSPQKNEQSSSDKKNSSQNLPPTQKSSSFNHKQAIQNLKSKRISAEQQSHTAGKQLQQISKDLQQFYIQQMQNNKYEQQTQENLNSIISTINQQQEESQKKYNQFRGNKVLNTIKMIIYRIYRDSIKNLVTFNNSTEKEADVDDYILNNAFKILYFKRMKRFFNSWYTVTRNEIDQRLLKRQLDDDKQDIQLMSDMYYHYQRQLLKRHLSYWKLYIRLQKKQKESNSTNNVLKSKITDFISNLKSNLQKQEILESEKYIQEQYQKIVEQPQQQFQQPSQQTGSDYSPDTKKQQLIQKYNKQKEKIYEKQQVQTKKIHDRLDKLKQQKQDIQEEQGLSLIHI